MINPTSAFSGAPALVRYRVKRALFVAGMAIRVAVFASAPVIGWFVTVVFLGALVGFSAIILPPAGTFAIPVIVGLVLLWALPDLQTVPTRSVGALLPIVLVVDLCVPSYYAIAGTGLPWISIRRIATLPLIVCVCLVVAGSREARARIAKRLAAAKPISACVIGYLVVMTLAIITSSAPVGSVSYTVDAVLIWYVPFVTIIYLASDERDVDKFIKVIGWCSVFISICGFVEWILQRNIFIDILPAPIFNALMESSVAFANVATSKFRSGEYHAPSVFNNPLPFGQFEVMIIPFGYYLLIHRSRLPDRGLGFLVVASGLLGVITSGARGAFVSLISATTAIIALWVLRTIRFRPWSLAPALVSVGASAGFTCLIILIFTWARLYNRVIGGHYGEQQSTQARWDEWAMALPHIFANPLTGHGPGDGADVVGYFTPGADFPTLDSLPISLLVETGLPGFLFFYGSVLFAIALGAREYLRDPSDRGALAGGLSCSLIAFVVNSLVLSAIENFTLLFLFLGLAVAVLSLDKQPEKAQTLWEARRRARRPTIGHGRSAGTGPRSGALQARTSIE
jgi:O-Antigen ligase